MSATEGCSKFGVRFTNQVWPGDTLKAMATVAGLREEDGQPVVDLTLSTMNQDGKEVDVRDGLGAHRSLNRMRGAGRDPAPREFRWVVGMIRLVVYDAAPLKLVSDGQSTFDTFR